MGGDDAVAEDLVDVGLRGQAAEGAGVILRNCGLDGGDAEVLVAPGEMGAAGGDAGLCVAGDGRVAIENEVAMRSDAVGVNLGAGDTGKKKCQDKDFPEDAPADRTCNRSSKSGRTKNKVMVNGHG
jgi:hypothetical protein